MKRCIKLLQQLQLSDLVGDLNHLRSNAGVGMPATASLVMFGRYSPPSDQGIMRTSLPCRICCNAWHRCSALCRIPFDSPEYKIMLHMFEHTLLTCSPACCMPAADTRDANRASRHQCNCACHSFKMPHNEGHVSTH